MAIHALRQIENKNFAETRHRTPLVRARSDFTEQAMKATRYFFNFTGEGRTLVDEGGVELDNFEQVKAYASKRAAVLRENAYMVEDWTEWRVEILDSSLRVVLTLPLTECVSG
ncbi:DUF6894 family protein [Bradyrhizobium genosp. SA-3]|uniref:DUF6894 family protein n=1 Tax=Bradyrhizobium genosp. SA-3 TaxID=508868 RepID=UPI001028B35D|nr:hypothetical protein [Bradyrhizobium genosp. SA-3]